MKIISKKLIFIIFIFILTLSLSGYFVYDFLKVDIEKVLETEEYSYLPEEAKEYVRKAYEETGNVILTEKNKKKNLSYLNPDYIRYLEMSNEEKNEVSDIPNAYTMDIDIRELDGNSSLPSSYDLRNDNGKNYVGPMYDQASTNLCWAFSSTEQIESLLLKNSNTEFNANTSRSFSVRQIDYATSTNGIINYDNYSNGYRSLGAGGNFFIASVAMSNGIVLQNNSSMPFDEEYNQKYLEDVFGYDNGNLEVNNAISIPGFDYDEEFTQEQLNNYISLVKSYAYSYGGVYVSTQSPDRSCGSVNIDGKVIVRVDDGCVENANHAMHIIGWDDNYSYQYCKVDGSHSSDVASCPSEKLVTGTGAWIVKNSWGELIPEAYQYIYLAYDAVNVSFGITTQVSDMNNRTWDNNYHDNFLDVLNGYVVNSDYEVNTKKFSGNEKLEKVKFLVYAVDATFKVNVTVGSKVYSNVQTIEAYLPGIYTIDLSEENIIIDNDTFKVEVVGEDIYSNLVSGTVSVFTSNQDESIQIKSNDVTVKKIYTNNASKGYEISLLSQTKNIKSGEYVSYKLFNGNEDISHMMVAMNDPVSDGVVQSRVANNEVLSNISINPNVGAGDYVLKIYYDNKEKTSVNIKLNGIVFVNGYGSEANPYIITNEEQLQMIRENINCTGSEDYICISYYKLGNDINLTKEWIPAGDSSLPFVGGFDGDGHTISGLKVNSDYYGGLFGYAVSTDIKNVTLEEPTINSKNYSGALIGFGGNLNISGINIIGGKVTATDGIAGNLIGVFLVTDSNSSVDSIYNSSVVSGKLSSGLIGYLGNESSYFDYELSFSISNILNVGNVNFKGFDGDYTKSSLVFGEVNYTIIDMSNIIVTGRVLSNSMITYNSIIGYYSQDGSVIDGTFNNVYYVNGNEGFEGNDVLGYAVKKSVSELRNSSSYTEWDNFSTKWTLNDVDGISRIPSPVNADFPFTSVEEIIIGKDKGGNLLDYIYPEYDAVNNITVSNVDEEFLTIDAGFNMKAVKTGETTIHISSDYDGYENDVVVTIVEKANPVIIFNSNDGRELTDKQTVDLNKEFVLKEVSFVKEGYTIVEWNTESDGSGDSFVTGDHIEGILEDVNLYAIWKENSYKVIYNYNGEFPNVEISVKYSDEFNTHINTHTKENYTFKEWNTKSDGTGKSYSGKVSKLSGKDGDVVNLYAIWKLNLSFTSDDYTIDETNKIIDMIEAKTDVKTFTNKLDISDGFTVIVDTGGNDLVYTGSKTKIYDGDKLLLEFVNIIRGDINGDGKISALDYVKVKNHIMGTNKIDSSSIYFKAADANTDDKISALDYVRIKNIIMKGAN